jgi:hypothetical protein
MVDIETKPLFTMQVRGALQPLGMTHGAERRVVAITECTIQGDRVKGKVLPGGSDWLTLEPDGALLLDCRMVLQTEDNALIGITYRGLRHGPPEEMAKQSRGEAFDTNAFYHRVALQFDTDAAQYKWMNRILAIGKARRLAVGAVYEVFEIL